MSSRRAQLGRDGRPAAQPAASSRISGVPASARRAARTASAEARRDLDAGACARRSPTASRRHCSSNSRSSRLTSPTLLVQRQSRPSGGAARPRPPAKPPRAASRRRSAGSRVSDGEPVRAIITVRPSADRQRRSTSSPAARHESVIGALAIMPPSTRQIAICCSIAPSRGEQGRRRSPRCSAADQRASRRARARARRHRPGDARRARERRRDRRRRRSRAGAASHAEHLPVRDRAPQDRGERDRAEQVGRPDRPAASAAVAHLRARATLPQSGRSGSPRPSTVRRSSRESERRWRGGASSPRFYRHEC